MGVKCALFLNGYLQEEVYVKQPSGFKIVNLPNHVFKLKKELFWKKLQGLNITNSIHICLIIFFNEVRLIRLYSLSLEIKISLLLKFILMIFYLEPQMNLYARNILLCVRNLKWAWRVTWHSSWTSNKSKVECHIYY